jgi:pyruvate-ferredoxin/flavodoxin oxidoreductase
MDGNEAAAWVAYRCSEVIGIYPITPASPMGELADQWAARGEPNLWGSVPRVVELQSEGGAAGALHGALQAGSLGTTFTASQGLLLMLPNFYKIAGELTPAVFHVAARSVATQALSIFGDHSDVMAARPTGWGMLFSSSVQEAMDLAAVAHAATLEARIPFLHVFDGFRTSHELQKIESLEPDDLRALLSPDAIRAHRARALSPDHPVIRGTAQNPDTFFQSREAANPFHLAAPEIVRAKLAALEARTGRRYGLVDYAGAPDAEHVIVILGSGGETARETALRDVRRHGAKTGVLQIRLYRPFPADAFLAALPETTRRVAVLDRTKEPGAPGEPLFLDVSATLAGAGRPVRVCGGRYGLSSKEFTPGMVRAVFADLAAPEPRRQFTVGIRDDVTHLSLEWTEEPERDDTAGETQAVFWGLGSDGTVGANKNAIKIIAEATDLHAQGYFVYDSKKAGARTISHLRFGPEPIRRPYLIQRAQFVGIHQFGFLSKFDPLADAAEGATVLVNSPFGADEVWDHLPRPVQERILQRNLKLHVIDAYSLAKELHLGMRINTIMQAAFFKLCPVVPPDVAHRLMREAIAHSYGKRGEAIVAANLAALEAGWEHVREARVPSAASAPPQPPSAPPDTAPDFVRAVTFPLMRGEGDLLPVSAFPPDGTYPTGTTRWEKRGIALEIPVWEPDLCIQCGKCVLVCPHAVIRAKLAPPEAFAAAPEGFARVPAKWRDRPGQEFTLQVAPDDCTGCSLCVEVCPARDKSVSSRKALNMRPKADLLDAGRARWEFFGESLPQHLRVHEPGDFHTVKEVQILEPLFEFSGACAGCGETPYLKLLTQLFGDRMVVANATGCSSIYGGNLPTTPWSTNREGRGPAWSNSLFEDNAEFGLGLRIALDARRDHARALLRRCAGLDDALVAGLLADDPEIVRQRERVAALKLALAGRTDPDAADLLALADDLTEKSVWIVGGDGWAYDIGYGGLDHVLSGHHDVNILVLDTEVYSNTGGQASKSTPTGAVAKFAAGGKTTPKKDLGWMAMAYGNAYVAQVAMGANDSHVLKTLHEAASYPGPSLVIAYSHCIAHGIDMAQGLHQQKLAERSGHWPLYRFDPRKREEGANPFQLDSKPPTIPLRDYLYAENRYRSLQQAKPDIARILLREAEDTVRRRRARHEQLAGTGKEPADHGTES